MNDISSRIKNARKKKNLTQEELGDLLFVSDKTISSWENDRTIPDIESINKISKSNVLSGKESNILTQALILQKNNMINDISEINIEILTPNWQYETPITITKFTLSFNNIQNYFDSIINALTNYNENISIDNSLI